MAVIRHPSIDLVDLEKETLAELVAERPEAQTDLDSSVGYAVISNTAAKVPMVGAGEGIGVVVNTETGERTYLEAGAGDHDDLGTGAGGVAGARNEKRALYQLSEAGVSATFTVRMIKYSVLELDG